MDFVLPGSVAIFWVQTSELHVSIYLLDRVFVIVDGIQANDVFRGLSDSGTKGVNNLTALIHCSHVQDVDG